MHVTLNAMNMVIYQQTVQIEYHHQACLHAVIDKTVTQGIIPDQLLDTITRTGTDIAGHNHRHTLADFKVAVTITQTEVILDHITDTTTGTLHDTITPTLIIIAMTHHTRDHPHIGIPSLIPEIAAGPDHVHHINQVRTPHLNPHPVLAGQQ